MGRKIQAFLEASETVVFEGEGRAELYGSVTRTLREQGYREQDKRGRGLLLRYLAKMTGLSRSQVTRLVWQDIEHSEVKEAPYQRRRFARRFTRGDIELLAKADEAHETLSGPATKRILEREFQEYGGVGYERLASISLSHLYNLRKRRHYRECSWACAGSDATKRRPASPWPSFRLICDSLLERDKVRPRRPLA